MCKTLILFYLLISITVLELQEIVILVNLNYLGVL